MTLRLAQHVRTPLEIPRTDRPRTTTPRRRGCTAAATMRARRAARAAARDRARVRAAIPFRGARPGLRRSPHESAFARTRVPAKPRRALGTLHGLRPDTGRVVPARFAPAPV